MGKSRSFRNDTSCRVENELKTIQLRARKVEKERVAIVNLGMNERRGNGMSSRLVQSVAISTKITYGDR